MPTDVGLLLFNDANGLELFDVAAADRIAEEVVPFDAGVKQTIEAIVFLAIAIQCAALVLDEIRDVDEVVRQETLFGKIAVGFEIEEVRAMPRRGKADLGCLDVVPVRVFRGVDDDGIDIQPIDDRLDFLHDFLVVEKFIAGRGLEVGDLGHTEDAGSLQAFAAGPIVFDVDATVLLEIGHVIRQGQLENGPAFAGPFLHRASGAKLRIVEVRADHKNPIHCLCLFWKAREVYHPAPINSILPRALYSTSDFRTNNGIFLNDTSIT